MNPTLAVKRSPTSPRRRAVPVILVAALLLVSPALITPSVAATTVSLFPTTGGSTITRASDTGAVEVGVRFQTSIAGTVTALRYYKPAQSPVGTKSGHLWSAAGALLASVNFTGETASGWQTATLAQPVALAKEHDVHRLVLRAQGRVCRDARLLPESRRSRTLRSPHPRRATGSIATARRPATRTRPTPGHRTTGPTSCSHPGRPRARRRRPRRRPRPGRRRRRPSHR